MTLMVNHMIGFGVAPSSALSADADVSAYVSAMTFPPPPALVSLLETLILDLKGDGVWSKLRWLSVFGLHDEQAGRINAKVPTEVASNPGSPTFTVARGFTGTSSTADLLNTNLPGTVLTDTDASLFAFVLARANSGTNIMGYDSSRGRLTHSTGSTNANGSIVTLTGSIRSGAANNQLVAVRRTGTSQVTSLDTANGTTSTVASNTVNQTATIRFLGTPSSASNTQLFAAGFGAYLTDTELSALNTRIRALATAQGAI